MMRKLGIIGAMKEEVALLQEKLERPAVTRRAGMDFWDGVLCGLPVTVVQSGIGKVNAALCVQVLADLWEVDAGLNEDITQLGVDLSGFTGLTEGEKAAVAYAFGMEHDILPVMGTWEELAEQGYIDRENLYWEDGCLFSITGETGKFDAQKWRSGLGAYFFLDCTASMEQDGTWTYTVGGEAIAGAEYHGREAVCPQTVDRRPLFTLYWEIERGRGRCG